MEYNTFARFDQGNSCLNQIELASKGIIPSIY